MYSEKQFRNSYFLFQQATEKANKAFALKFGLAQAENLKDAGHNQFKIMRNYIFKKLEEFNTLPIESQKNPDKFGVKKQGMVNSLSLIDKLRNEDLVNISTKDINKLYKELSIFQIPYKLRFTQIREYFDKSKESKNVNHISQFLIQWTQDFFYILIVLFSCALLTIQHSSLTRYPESDKNPLRIYNLKLPLVRKQILFMNLLEDAIKKMKAHTMQPKFLNKMKTKNVN